MLKLLLITFFCFTIINNNTALSKTYSDKDGQKIEFPSFFGKNIWGDKSEPITAHGVLYLPQQASSINRVPLTILI